MIFPVSPSLPHTTSDGAELFYRHGKSYGPSYSSVTQLYWQSSKHFLGPSARGKETKRFLVDFLIRQYDSPPIKVLLIFIKVLCVCSTAKIQGNLLSSITIVGSVQFQMWGWLRTVRAMAGRGLGHSLSEASMARCCYRDTLNTLH